MVDAEINWDRLDKRKFFVYGVGLFSCVTTALYPLSVIKTRQMANNAVSGGLAGTRATAASIWRREGVRGYYRGFGTVVFGTIPSRSIYLSTLEVTKAAVTRLGQQAELAPTTLAATSSFLAGAAASLSTQVVIVPVDVISQRLMVQGDEALAATAAGTAPQAQPGSSGSGSGRGSSSSSASSSSGQQRGPISSPAAMSTKPAAAAGGGAAAAAAGQSSSPASSSRSYHSSSSSSNRLLRSQQLLHQLRQRQGPHQTWGQAAAAQAGSSDTGCSSSSSRSFSHSQRPASSSVTTSTTTSSSSTVHCRAATQQGLRFSSSSSSSSSPAAAAVRLGPRNGVQMARLIVAEEGLRGLYRGFWPSVATFAPSSAVWWGSYGFWQKAIWLNLHSQQQQQPGSSRGGSSSSSSSSGGGGSGAGGAGGTGRVVAVQVASAVLAGFTASLATNPLDVVKTRLQVADAHGGGGGGGAAPSWRQVLLELLARQGVLGLWRGVIPRMLSSAMWGTAMVSTYEFLKRSCVIPLPEGEE